ncbi:predicted protein [Postia placenta Mad-698-R]|nr:predicted protein [Postia placenta Mad-698-R]
MQQPAPPPASPISSRVFRSAGGFSLAYAMHWPACPSLSDIRAAHTSHSLKPQEDTEKAEGGNGPARDGEAKIMPSGDTLARVRALTVDPGAPPGTSGFQDRDGELVTTTRAADDNLFAIDDEASTSPAVGITISPWLKSPPQPGATMPTLESCHPGCSPTRVRLARGAAPTWICRNPEPLQTVRKVNIRKRGSTPYQMKLPGMSVRAKVRDGSVVAIQHVPPALSHTLVRDPPLPVLAAASSRLHSSLNPAALSYVLQPRVIVGSRGRPGCAGVRPPPLPAARSDEALREWARTHRVGPFHVPRLRQGAALAHHRAHMQWTAAPNATPRPTPVAMAVPLSTLVQGRTRVLLRSQPHTPCVVVSASTPAVAQEPGEDATPSEAETGTALGASRSWDELLEDLLDATAEFRRALAAGSPILGSWQRDPAHAGDSEPAHGLNWAVWEQRVLLPAVQLRK